MSCPLRDLLGQSGDSLWQPLVCQSHSGWQGSWPGGAGKGWPGRPARCSLKDVHLHMRCFVWHFIVEIRPVAVSNWLFSSLPSLAEMQITSIMGKTLTLQKRFLMDTEPYFPFCTGQLVLQTKVVSDKFSAVFNEMRFDSLEYSSWKF